MLRILMCTENISDPWSIRYSHYDPDDEGRREAVFALGNGYLVSRAAAPEALDDGIHYPGTYRVGCYNRLTSIILHRKVENESLVNLPNWLLLTFRIDEGRWFSLDEVEIIDYQQTLNMQEALLERKVHFRDQQGRQTMLCERRFISMVQPHLMGLEIKLTAENWSGVLEVNTALDGRIINNNVRRYRAYNKRHLKTLFAERLHTDTIALKARTVQSGIAIAVAARTRLRISDRITYVKRTIHTEEDLIEDRLHVLVKSGERVIIEKIAALYTSRDLAIADCGEAAQNVLAHAANFDTLFMAHASAWKQLWRRCKINMNSTHHLRCFRLHIFQIMQNISPHTADLDVGVPPSGWQGEEYHGQIFWDELFVLQFLTYRFPSVARSVLLYRYRRLDEARCLAKQYGYRGAMFPWRSASTGREETPLLQLNLYSGHWIKDKTYLQRHIGAVIAYNICHYILVTGDHHFLEDYGAELLLEIARFWASKAIHNPKNDRYEIQEVVGPDEYHTSYPGAAVPGINNNSYTNVMAAWTLRQASHFFKQLSEQRKQDLWERLGLSTEEFSQWDRVSRNIYIPFLNDGIMDQFEGFSALQKFDLEQYRKQYEYKRIDWGLEAMGDSVEHYQVSKQADTSLLLYLFSPVELQEMLKYMGYSVDDEMLKRTVHYHLAHTAHESSLSRIVQAGALALLDKEASWKLFQKAQLIDLLPEEHKDTSEGIHLGAMGGTLVLLQYYYLGLRAQSGVLIVDPSLPEGLEQVQVTFFFHSVEIECLVTPAHIKIKSVHKNAPLVKVAYKQKAKDLLADSTVTYELTV